MEYMFKWIAEVILMLSGASFILSLAVLTLAGAYQVLIQ